MRSAVEYLEPTGAHVRQMQPDNPAQPQRLWHTPHLCEEM
jgi:hypothetical protein